MEWQPIESAPKGKNVLLIGESKKPWIGDWAEYCIFNSPKITHWMPLPDPPA